MDKEYLKSVIKYVLSAAAAIIIIAYIIIQFSESSGTDIVTSPVSEVSQKQALTASAYLFRDESVIYSPYSGVISYLCADGEKISASTHVADVYAADNVSPEVENRILQLDNKIRLLEQSNVTPHDKRFDTSSTDLLIKKYLFSYIGASAAGDISTARASADNMLVNLNRRRIIIGSVSGYKNMIAELEAEKKAVCTSNSFSAKKIVSQSSGYFSQSADGYENIMSGKAVDSLTYSSFKELVSMPPETLSDHPSGTPIGKVITDFSWYIACEADKSDVYRFGADNNYEIIFPMCDSVSVSATLYKTLSDFDSDSVILIFRSGDRPDNLRFLRNQTVRIVSGSFSGYRVPVSAVRLVDGRPGVYILRGITVNFRNIDILYEYDGYYVVSNNASAKKKHADDDGAEKLSWLDINDLIIVEGKDLYDGRVVN